MKFQPKSSLISSVLPLIGAAIFLVSLPVTAQAQAVPDLQVTKVCVNGPLQSVLCTVTVTNLGTVPSVSPLKLTDVVTGAPANALFTGGGGTLPISCSPGAGPVLPIACSANIALLPNQPKTALFSFKLPTGGSFTNCATVTQQTATGPLPDPNPNNSTNICTTISVPSPSGGGGPITIVTPPPLGACITQTPVSGLHYPAQSCSQSTPGFLAGMMTSFHFKSKCTAPNTLLGVTNVSCQNAPIPGFPTGSVYQGTACCGTVPPPTGTGTVTLKKVLVPATDIGKFTLQLKNGGGLLLANFLNGGNGAVMGPVTVPAGNYNVSEAAGTGTSLSNYTSVISGAGCGTNGAVTVAAGDNKVCTITNTRVASTGTVTLKKVLVPATDTGKFTLQLKDGGGLLLANFLNGGNGAVMGPVTVPAGNYNVSEAAGTGTSLSNYTSVISGAGCGTNGAVTVAAGDNKVCTITNTRVAATGTLTIVKVVQPAGNLQAFTFTSNVPTTIPTFQLDNNPGTGTIPSSKTFTNLPAGVPYTVTESAASGWTTPSLQCLVAVPGSTTTFTDQLNRTFTVNLAAGANVTCTFTNLKTWPSTAAVNIYNPMTPFGPQTVNISVGGTVTFNNVNSGAPWTITWLSGPSLFGPVPLPTSPSSGTTSPFTTPGTYTYTINGTPSFTLPGTIIVH